MVCHSVGDGEGSGCIRTGIGGCGGKFDGRRLDLAVCLAGGIWWGTVGSGGVWWDTEGYGGIRRDMEGYGGVRWDMVGYGGMSCPLHRSRAASRLFPALHLACISHASRVYLACLRQGSPVLFTAMFKAVEDRLNMKNDAKYGVQASDETR